MPVRGEGGCELHVGEGMPVRGEGGCELHVGGDACEGGGGL